MIYNETDVIEESLKRLKIFNHNKREYYVNKLLDYYNGTVDDDGNITNPELI